MPTPGKAMLLGALLSGSGAQHLVRLRTFAAVRLPLQVPMIQAALQTARGA
jgi:hypothetical protein